MVDGIVPEFGPELFREREADWVVQESANQMIARKIDEKRRHLVKRFMWANMERIGDNWYPEGLSPDDRPFWDEHCRRS